MRRENVAKIAINAAKSPKSKAHNMNQHSRQRRGSRFRNIFTVILRMRRQLHDLWVNKIDTVKLTKQQILMSKTSRFKTVCNDGCGYITQLK